MTIYSSPHQGRRNALGHRHQVMCVVPTYSGGKELINNLTSRDISSEKIGARVSRIHLVKASRICGLMRSAPGVE